MFDWIAAHAPVIALVGFFVGWVGVAIWTYLPRNKTKIEKNRDIPLQGD